MYVDVLWILISDAGSTPATSTRLRFELAKNEDYYGVAESEAESFYVGVLMPKTTPGEPKNISRI